MNYINEILTEFEKLALSNFSQPNDLEKFKELKFKIEEWCVYRMHNTPIVDATLEVIKDQLVKLDDTININKVFNSLLSNEGYADALRYFLNIQNALLNLISLSLEMFKQLSISQASFDSNFNYFYEEINKNLSAIENCKEFKFKLERPSKVNSLFYFAHYLHLVNIYLEIIFNQAKLCQFKMTPSVSGNSITIHMKYSNSEEVVSTFKNFEAPNEFIDFLFKTFISNLQRYFKQSLSFSQMINPFK